MSDKKKVLFFSPYSAWLIHSQVDAVIAKALQIRECEVQIVICDGIYKDCYITRQLVGQEAVDTCQSCSQIGSTFFASFGLPSIQLRNFITSDDYSIATQWIEAIKPDEYTNAVYEGVPIGEWIISSIYTYFRISAQSLSRPDVIRVYKHYLIDGLLTYKAISKLLDLYQPTNLFVFNGRIAPFRIAFEIARQRQIDTIIHERSYISDTFNLYDNCICLNIKPALDHINAWKNIPLKQTELLQVKQYFINREAGIGFNWPSFYDFQNDYVEVRRKLRIPVDAKIFTVFTSSEDELTDSENYLGITKQLSIIDNLIDIFADRDEYLIIRHHPFIAGDKVTRPNTDFISRAYQQALSAPKNVRIIMPSEQLTSYALLWHTEASIAFFSTVSIEAAARGIPTACFNTSEYHQALRYVIDHSNLTPESLEILVENLLSESAQSTIDDLRKLYRFTHAYFFKFPNKFTSFGIKDSYYHDLRFKSFDELKPNNDPALDRVCDRIIHGTYLYDMSGSDDPNRSVAEEEKFLQQELLEVGEYNQKVKEQSLLAQYNSFPNHQIGIIYLQYKGEKDNNRLLKSWVEQSRHENIVVHSCNNLERDNYQDVIDAIISILEVSREDYILIVNNQCQYDESCLSSALDILLADENQGITGVFFGAWLTTVDNGIQIQIFTKSVPISTYQQAVEIFPWLQYPQNLLSFTLIRSDALWEILNKIKQIPTANQVGDRLFSMMNENSIHKIDIPMLVVHQHEQSQSLSSQILNWINSYHQEQSHEIALDKLREFRQYIADSWLKIQPDQLSSAYSLGDIGKAHNLLMNSGIKNEPLTDTEVVFANQISEKIAMGLEHPKAIQHLLVAMLYGYAHQLPIGYDCQAIPEWFINNYVNFILQSPSLFQEIGEVDHYYHYLQGWVDYLHSNIFNQPEKKIWQKFALAFINHANFIPLYFSTGNLRNIYSQRADIMEFALKNIGADIDYIFPDRSPNRPKIRFGVLNAHFTPHTETFHTIPAFEYLDRNQFEIILYCFQITEHPLEQYCRSRADKIVRLPEDLNTQVQTIRADELDILLIGTNVTAVTNKIVLLALHRLARIQVTFGSSPATTGMGNIDYFISGNLSELIDIAQEHYREKLAIVNGPGYCFNYTIEPEVINSQPSRNNWGIDEKSIVFISGANFFKIIPELRNIWAKILSVVPNSVLVLYPFAPSWTNYYPVKPFIQQMNATLSQHGVDSSRLIVLNSLPNRVEVKECLKLADIYLDSPRHSGGHSLVDALEVGLPTVVMEGEFLRSRHAAAYLRELQLPELITDNEVDYIQVSAELANNIEWRMAKSQEIREKMHLHPRFFNSRDYSTQIGKLFHQLFEQHQVLAIQEQYKLRDTNLIIFPDWNQPEESIGLELQEVITVLATYPNSQTTTLLIDTSNIDVEDAEMFLSSVAMNLLMEEDLDMTEELEISLLGKLSNLQWKILLPCIQARIILTSENQETLAKLAVEKLPYFELEKLQVSVV